MTHVKIPNYQVRRNGRGFWEPTKRMRALGFQSVPCGADGPIAWAIAEQWNARWQQARRGVDASSLRSLAPDNLSTTQVEELTVYPRGSIGEGFRRYRRLDEWTKGKKPATRDDWWRGWRRIKPVFGDVDPRTVTLEHVSAWRSAVLAKAGVREAHRAVKIWRALWQVLAGLHYCNSELDPSFGFSNPSARGRTQIWSEGEAVRLVKEAWRMGYRGLAAALAVMWDSQLSPGDVRMLVASRIAREGCNLAIRTERGKTAKSVGTTLSARATAIVDAYRAEFGAEVLGDSPVFRNRSGDRYLKNAFAEDFRAVRAAVFGVEERRQMLDFRRSGAVEAITGGARPEHLSHAMGNTLSASNQLYETYVPAQNATVDQVREARRLGRNRLREANKDRTKVGTPGPTKSEQRKAE